MNPIKIIKQEKSHTTVIEGSTGKIIFDGLTEDYIKIVSNVQN